MTSDSAIFLTNAASVGADRRRVAKGHPREKTGAGRVLTIMCAPRHFERGEGHVPALKPFIEDLRALKAGRIDVAEYRSRYERPTADLAPGRLFWVSWADGNACYVAPGAILTCACSAEAAERGECHRSWAAGLLVAAGWPEVILDGRPVFGVDDKGRPVRERARSEGA